MEQERVLLDLNSYNRGWNDTMNSRGVKEVLENIYSLEALACHRQAAKEIMIFIEKNLDDDSVDVVNEILEKADISRLSSRSLIGLIRSTARVKGLLPAWKIAYKNAFKKIKEDGKNPEALFVGIAEVC